MSMISMSEQEYYCELFKHISKEMLANMYKAQKMGKNRTAHSATSVRGNKFYS